MEPISRTAARSGARASLTSRRWTPCPRDTCWRMPSPSSDRSTSSSARSTAERPAPVSGLQKGLDPAHGHPRSCEQMSLPGTLKGAEITDGTMIENQRLGAHPAQQLMIVAGQHHDAWVIDYFPHSFFFPFHEIR